MRIEEHISAIPLKPSLFPFCKQAARECSKGVTAAGVLLKVIGSVRRKQSDTLQGSGAGRVAAMSTHADCRMYESKYPDVDDVVMVQVKSIAEMGAYVSLLEYNGIEGMILLSELSRRRIRSITKLIKVCKLCPSPMLRMPFC